MIEQSEFFEKLVIKPGRLIRAYFHTYQVYSTIDMHSHDFYELNVVIKGSGTHQIGAKTFDIQAGAVFLIPPDVKHGYNFSNNNFSIFHILFTQHFFEKYATQLKAISGYNIMFETEPELRLRQGYKSNFLLYFNPAKEQALLNTFAELAALEDSESQNMHTRQEFLTLYIVSTLCERIENFQDSHLSSKSQYYYVMKAVDYIQNNCHEKINLDDICDYINMSRAVFFRHFKACLGCTPLTYLHLCRIKQAKVLLRSSDKSVATIAQDCGFCDSSNFIHLFTKYEGITPYQYKKQISTPPPCEVPL